MRYSLCFPYMAILLLRPEGRSARFIVALWENQAISMHPPLELHLLGGFHAGRLDSAPISLSGRLQALLAYIILRGGEGCSRQEIAFALWPDSSEKQARTNLRRLLLLLRRALPEIQELLHTTSQRLIWQPTIPVVVDLFRFRAALEQGAEGLGTRRAILDRALEAYRGDLLPDCYDEWILPLREGLRDDYARLLDERAQLAEEERDYPTALVYVHRLLDHDPLNEIAQQRLLRLLAFQGDRAGALQAYHAFAHLLSDELGVNPSPETQRIHQRLLQQDEAQISEQWAQTAPSDRLVGRVRPWRKLLAAWADVQNGTGPHWVLVAGCAGMGKSRLVEEMRQWAERQGMRTAYARSYPSGAEMGYGLVTELLRQPALQMGWASMEPPWLVELARLFPEILAHHPHLSPPGPLTETWQQQRLWEGLCRAFPTDEPMVWFLDDLHWSDALSLRWLLFLLQRHRHLPLLLVGTARSDEMGDNPGLMAAVQEAEGRGQCLLLPLEPLSLEESCILAAQSAGAAWVEGEAHALYTVAGGNPLFTVEIARAMVAETTLQDRDEDVTTSDGTTHRIAVNSLPIRVRRVVEQRLARLPSPAYQVAAVAAVVGQAFQYPLLAAAAVLDEEALIDAVDTLCEREILREVRGERYDFSHDLIRDVAYASLGQARRSYLHRQVALALEQLHLLDCTPVLRQLGYHHGRGGDVQRAVYYLCEAAHVAHTRYYAHEEAAALLDEAYTLAQTRGPSMAYKVVVQREEVNRTGHRMAAWTEDLALLERLMRELDDGSPDALRRRAHSALARHRFLMATQTIPEARQPVEEATRYAQACGHPTLETHCRLAWGHLLWLTGELESAREQLAAAYELAMDAGLPILAANALERRAQIHMFRGGTAHRISELLQEALQLYRQAGDENGECNILNKWGYLPMAQGNGGYSQAEGHFAAALVIARRTGNRSAEQLVQRNLGVLYTCQGETARAEASLAEAWTIVEELHNQQLQGIIRNYQGFVYLNQERLDAAQVAQEEALATLRAQGNELWAVRALTGLGWIAFYQGNLLATDQWARQAMDAARILGDLRQVAHALTCAGWGLLGLARAEEALPLFQEAGHHLHALGMCSRAQEPLAGRAAALMCVGRLHAAREQAVAVAEYAATHWLDRTAGSYLALAACAQVLECLSDQGLAPLQRTMAEHRRVRKAGHPAGAQKGPLYPQLPNALRAVLSGLAA